MTQTGQIAAAKDFAEFWKDRGDEKQESQRFWIDLLQNVLGVTNPTKYIEFEKRVQLSHTSYIDAYIFDTKVLIEQKGSKIDIHKAYEQSDGAILTPFEQAKRYADELPNSIRPRWIVVCNFSEFLIYDLEKPHAEPQQIFLKDLPKEFYRLQFLVDQKNENIRREEEISIEAGKLVDKLYQTLLPQYKPSCHSELVSESQMLKQVQHDVLSNNQLRSLNILCVRIVFCLYAEDAGLFETRTSFEDYIRGFNLPNVRLALKKLFKALDTKIPDRDEYDESLKPFPYVNGGLFKDENIEIPNFTQEIVDVIVNDCSVFNWSEISPTIFGAVFESTLNPETRRKGGMHYTSIQNIHKVIDPLFMDDLSAEFEQICATKTAKQKAEKLHAFQTKLGSLKFLDPACGSGNFLTETYLSLRRLENKVISILNKGEKAFGFDEFIKVHINQFYGIEINDFAVTVAKTALWIAESQMVAETEAILSQAIDFLPLKTGANIVEGNALRMDWSTLRSEDTGNRNELPLFQFTAPPDSSVLSSHSYDYIIGNPPFVGYSLQSDTQKEDTLMTYVNEIGKPYKSAGKIDYVANWYFKAARIIQNKRTRCAFVSTNSICQGEQVAAVWKPIFGRFKIHFDFAYKTFKWSNETTDKKNMAAVHCVIIGFSHAESNKPKKIFLDESNVERASNINAYLMDGENIFIESRSIPIYAVPQMSSGGKPVEGGNLIFTEDEKNEFLKKEPKAEKYFRPFMGSDDFINGHGRWCLWLLGVAPNILRSMPHVMKRVEAVREFRLASVKAATREYANYPSQFMEIKQPESDYLMIPATSSENRRYVPIGYLDKNVVASNAASFVPNATLYHFGILTSSVHNAWMRCVAGRLKSDYRYSVNIVYNNFPWPHQIENGKLIIEKELSETQKLSIINSQLSIQKTAQAILDTRKKYPDSTLADLYDETFMPKDLRKAHEANDRAVIAAYGFKADITESEIVGELFKLYAQATKATS